VKEVDGMNRFVIFGTMLVAGLGCLMLVAMYWSGTGGFAHTAHLAGPLGIRNFKHGLVFLGGAVIAFVIAAIKRPSRRGRSDGASPTGS
jgi:hypothetical protein